MAGSCQTAIMMQPDFRQKKPRGLIGRGAGLPAFQVQA
ncbi:Uncharacterized protein AC518_1652 [Pseudomonas syringae pv. syringae]|uniref:Uncharacterized protein n=3 Tax=Pseudomonas syringae group TaxID=136849 RepID=A0A3M5WK50_9PSED|nr:Uncharacterized protein ABJ98_5020 [Pseudomonas syringae pv. aceris]KPB20678.1 Uncharacterized protein AC518_1652 [Pseudomonas syringae pv. syringae]RMT37635.1 hypothetical protein ALP48_102023 [Pseudomonas syringae pv. solidagae]RMU70879.1 hypothetical protein ALP23_101745 [Pseudomonas syringae pv. apii]KPW18682.1 hypothetical protein ALO91_102350 [Pseudomonas syringae pv. aceris]